MPRNLLKRNPGKWIGVRGANPRIQMKHFRPNGGSSFAQIMFRVARVSDAPELLRLIRAYYRFDGIRFQKSVIDAALRKLLRNRSLGRIWIMRDGVRPAGYVMLTFNYDLEFGGLEGIVTDLFIESEYRNRGLGRNALELVYDYSRSAGIRTIELQVEEHNENAQAFYRKLGFRKLRRIVMSQDVRQR